VVEVLTPIRFDRIAMRGETKPAFITCETDQGEKVEVVVKTAGHMQMGIKPLAIEWALANLAGDLSLPVCKPYLVRLDKEFLADIPNREWAEKARQGNQVAFGSQLAGSTDCNQGFGQWELSYTPIGPQLTQAWHAIAFDAWTDNVDRRISNANCLVRGQEFRLIDHEKCFSALIGILMIGGKPRKPWDLDGAAHILTPEKHIFAQCLSSRSMPRASIRDAWLDLPTDLLNSYEKGLPPEWAEAVPIIGKIVSAIVEIQANIDSCLNELERCLK
jgi:hypothetical protein